MKDDIELKMPQISKSEYHKSICGNINCDCSNRDLICSECAFLNLGQLVAFIEQIQKQQKEKA